MEHPPKQGLKQQEHWRMGLGFGVLMEHPPKQGLKLIHPPFETAPHPEF